MTGPVRQLLSAALLLSLGLNTAPSAAAPDSADLARQLTSHSPECGRFSQNRWLADFAIDIESTGTFRRTGEAIVWSTETPVQNTIHLSADNPDLPPGFRLVVPVMTALLGGDWERLNEHFQADISGDLASWQADLVPLDSRVATRLPKLHIEGGRLLEKIDMHFAEGDQLTLSLTPVQCPGNVPADRP